jgi:hypothetical protein
LDEQISKLVERHKKEIESVQTEIFKLNKEITDIECPKDDSFDNSVVLWLSQAFTGSSTSNEEHSSSGATETVFSVYNQLQDAGYTIRKCVDMEEVVNIAQDLRLEGQLRCIIIGGGEKSKGCGPSCTKLHSGNCLVCGEGSSGHRYFSKFSIIFLLLK